MMAIFQLGAVISQKGKLIACYGKNIVSQRGCKVTEREILSIIETLKEFRTTVQIKSLTNFSGALHLLHHYKSNLAHKF